MTEKYKILRHYYKGGHRILKRGLSLEEAQVHCSDPESKSKTATSPQAKKVTKRSGPWYDKYDPD